MLRALLLLLLWPSGRVLAQTSASGLGVDLGLCPLACNYLPDNVEDWSTDQPVFATMARGAVSWTFRKDGASLGLGCGVFVQEDRTLYPIFVQVYLPVTMFYRDTANVCELAQRLSIEARSGMMFGAVELNTDVRDRAALVELAVMYRIRRTANASLRVGVGAMNLSWRVRTGQRDREFDLLSVGPMVQLAF